MLPIPAVPSRDQSLLIGTSEECTSEWVSALVKKPATVVDVRSIGTGQVSKTVRVKFTLEGSDEVESLVVKMASESEDSKAVGFGGLYEKESTLYAELGELLASTTAVPYCWLAVFEPKGIFTLVLEDMQKSTQGDQLGGCTADVAEKALTALAKLQAPFLGAQAVEKGKKHPWLLQPEGSPEGYAQIYSQCLPVFFERYSDIVTPEDAELMKYLDTRIKHWADIPPPDKTVWGLVHDDYRLDNILFPDPEDPNGRIVGVDFQGVHLGLAVADASYFMGTSLLPEERRKHEKDLLRKYLTVLNGGDDSKLDWDTAWYQYRWGAVWGIVQAVVASIVVVRTPRGDKMFNTMNHRHCEHCRDINIYEVFP